MKLCELAEDITAKYYFNRKAEESFENDFTNVGCGKKAQKAAAKELIYVEQYCYDYIDPSVYIDETKSSIKHKHDMYVNML